MNRHIVIAGAIASLMGPAFAGDYSNGPVITDPGAGANGSDASALQSLIGLQVLGFGTQTEVGNRLADDFTIPSNNCASWKITRFEFMMYQSGAPTTNSTFTAVNLRIWNGPPGAEGSQIVWGDTETNRLTKSVFSDIYRVTDMTLQVNVRPLFSNICEVDGPVLAPGTYWVDWQADGTIFSGPWVPGISIKGQLNKPGSNALQYLANDDQWKPVIDTGLTQAPQDLQFAFGYEEVPFICYGDCDASCSLDVEDFICFQTYYALGDLYADCDLSGSLSIDDFICFQTVYAVGC